MSTTLSGGVDSNIPLQAAKTQAPANPLQQIGQIAQAASSANQAAALRAAAAQGSVPPGWAAHQQVMASLADPQHAGAVGTLPAPDWAATAPTWTDRTYAVPTPSWMQPFVAQFGTNPPAGQAE